MASGLAAKIMEETGIETTLVEGSAGVFDVSIDGTIIFSKNTERRFPQDVEIIDAVKKLQE